MESSIKRILVPTDFSPSAHAALDYALLLAKPLGATVELCHIGPRPDYAAAALVSPGMRSAATGLLRQLEAVFEESRKEMEALKASRASAGVPLEVSFGEGFADEGIVQRAKDGDADLIVMGSHGRRGLSRMLLGSVAERVLRLAPCPVLVVHGPPEPPAAAQ